MFSKLLKYDFRAVKRFGFIILIVIAATTVLGSIDLAYIIGLARSGVFEEGGFVATMSITGSIFFMYFIVFVLGLASFAMLLVTMIHFYKNLITDEGYLTFTLPVTPKQILLSKFTNSTLWSLTISVAIGLSVIIMVLVGLGSGGILGDTFKLVFEALGYTTWQFWVIAFLMILFSLASLANTHFLYYMAIVLGSIIVKKNKALAAIGCVIGINFIYSSVTSVVYTLFMNFTFFIQNFTASIIVLLAVGTAMLSGLSYLFYRLTLRMLSSSLNLP